MQTDKILILDDDKAILRSLDRFFKRRDFETYLASDAPSAIQLFTDQKPSLVLADIRLPGTDGIDIVTRMKKIDSAMSVILMTGDPAQEFILRGLKMGAADFLTKPINGSQLSKAVDRVLRKKRESLEQQHQAQTLQKLVDDREGELKQVQRELYQSSKMSALGELAAGLAHEVNQPLTALKLTCQDLLYSMDQNRPPDKDIHDSLQDMLKQMDMISHIVNHMRTFARTPENETAETADMNDLIRDILSLTNYQFRKRNISIRTDFYPDLPAIKTYPIKIQQVLMNFISNARDALMQSEKSVKSILISSNVRTTIKPNFLPRKELVLSVQDNADGIPKEIRDKIFLPFYTTKERGIGTGLGLSISKKIIEGLGGDLECESEPGEGSRFNIVLPLEDTNREDLEAAA